MTSALRTGLLAALLLAPGLSGGTVIELSAEVDRTMVALGERLLLTVTATGTDIGGLPQPSLPRMADFKSIGTLWGRFTSDPTSGSEASRQTAGFVYTLEPKRTGNLMIGPVRLVHEGAVYQTQPIAVRVVAAGDSVPPLERWTEANGIVLVCTADRSSVHVGEQVQVTYRLFSRARVGAVMMKDAPAFTGFWVAQLDGTGDLDWRAATRAGQACSVALIRQEVLFPVQPGELAIGRMTLAGVVAVPGGLFKGMPAPFTVSNAKTKRKLEGLKF